MSLDLMNKKRVGGSSLLICFGRGEEFGKCKHLLPCRLFPWMLALCFPKPSADSLRRHANYPSEFRTPASLLIAPS
jgi:hypothetical protein